MFYLDPPFETRYKHNQQLYSMRFKGYFKPNLTNMDNTSLRIGAPNIRTYRVCCNGVRLNQCCWPVNLSKLIRLSVYLSLVTKV